MTRRVKFTTTEGWCVEVLVTPDEFAKLSGKDLFWVSRIAQKYLCGAHKYGDIFECSTSVGGSDPLGQWYKPINGADLASLGIATSEDHFNYDGGDEHGDLINYDGGDEQGDEVCGDDSLPLRDDSLPLGDEDSEVCGDDSLPLRDDSLPLGDEDSEGWTYNRTMRLLNLYEELIDAHPKKSLLFKAIYLKMRESGDLFPDSIVKVQRKVLNMKKKLKKMLDSNSKSGRGRHQWPYYPKMMEIFGKDPAIEPDVTVSVGAGRCTIKRKSERESHSSSDSSPPSSRRRTTRCIMEDMLKELKRSNEIVDKFLNKF